ncbi:MULTISPECIES: YrvL family regulatory protein [unclassified Sutcliffiella]|uniref:YrvL family regulatory protein n=1 Tax=unclassified Sutcliffiella TaxID=2837532 RepID=UPI0030CFA012
MGHDNDPNLNVTDKIILAISMTFLVILAIFVIGGGFVFGFAGLFQLFSVDYESKSALIYYVMLLIPLTLLFEVATFFVILRLIILLKKPWAILTTTAATKYLFSWFPLYLTDEIIPTIAVPLHTELVAALLLCLLDSIFHKKR